MASKFIYPIIFILAVYFMYTNLKNNLTYKKLGMVSLFYLKDDDRGRQRFAFIVIAFVLALAATLITGTIRYKQEFNVEHVFTMIVLPLVMLILYIPLTKKTYVSNLGIHKRGSLIKWENIKSINYLKPDDKGIVLIKIIHTMMSKDVSTNLSINKEDTILETFKITAKEYRSKKKDKKSGK